MTADDQMTNEINDSSVEAAPSEVDGAGVDTPHSARVVVWDVPSTLESGQKFSIKLGVKCSSDCRPDGWRVEIRDQDGQRRGQAVVGSEPWPGTDALFRAEIDLSAPDTQGLHAWEARVPVDGLDIPHVECIAPFGVRVVPPSECLLTVLAIDMESQKPVEGAKVVVHPYEAFTDKCGVAEVRLPRGGYRLFVAGRKYFPFRSDGEMSKDVTIRAELTLDLEISDADVWY